MIVSAAAAVVVVEAGAPPALRVPIVFWFVCGAAGLAWTNLLPLKDELAVWVFGIALSLVAATLLSEALVLLKHWSPTAILVVLVAASLPPSILAVRPRHRTADGGGAA